jgi:hypothetical protein
MSTKKQLTEAQQAEEVKRRNKRIRDRNYRFGKMTRAQQRVTLAKDIIKNVISGKFIAEQGSYVSFNYDNYVDNVRAQALIADARGSGTQDKLQMCQVFEAAEKCTVCGIGGAYVAAVLRADKLTLDRAGSLGNDVPMRKYLDQFFSREQQALIECAFEGDSTFQYISHDSNVTGAQTTRAKARSASKFGQKFDEPDERLIAIMENVIENDGTFIP